MSVYRLQPTIPFVHRTLLVDSELPCPAWGQSLAMNIEDAATEEMRTRAVLKRAGLDEGGRVHITYTVTK